MSMRFVSVNNVWKLTDEELPDKDETVMLKYCTINLEDGETQVFESEGQFVGVKNGKANYTIAIEEKFGEPSFTTLPNNFTKLIAWRRIKDVVEDKQEDTLDKVIAEVKSIEINRDADSQRQNDYCDGCDFTIKQVLRILDKYKTEREG